MKLKANHADWEYWLKHRVRYRLTRRGVRGGFAASWIFSSRRQALTLLERHMVFPAGPNVRVNRPAEASAVSLD
jgi:hypothetical protein